MNGKKYTNQNQWRYIAYYPSSWSMRITNATIMKKIKISLLSQAFGKLFISEKDVGIMVEG